MVIAMPDTGKPERLFCALGIGLALGFRDNLDGYRCQNFCLGGREVGCHTNTAVKQCQVSLNILCDECTMKFELLIYS